ncbi:hypothetical protein DPMN_189364 [Dreissena polymorpha]|uniref:C-type lectin domain-containing protein n=1 Tax=Dreissena polymorpha TaxID=45954 RepID=A0A9D4DTE6_DREPO|nr:hypothetical protein DPMN_189364 [Dreissena polymorpha]
MNEADFESLVQIYEAYTAWIGGQKIMDTWQWITRERTQIEMEYQHWNPGKPVNYTDACIAMWTSSGWQDYPCTGNMWFICNSK